MIEHNEAILQCLNDYIRVDKPGYAVFIKGIWGCGKTFFIKEWLKDLEKKGIFCTLKPIYVSLYGMSSTVQIDEEIKRVVSPFLYGKTMKNVSKLIDVGLSAALRIDMGMIKDDDMNMQFKCSIDPKSLFCIGNQKKEGKRLVVFDDLERSKMDISEVLGYINYYVEHIGCNVVIVGDDSKLLADYSDVREKTIGRELEIEPDVDSVIDPFVKKSLDVEYLEKNKNVIKECFRTSGSKNLRVLKQSLDDFCLMMNRIHEGLKRKSEFEKIKVRFLANFVAVYAEDKCFEVGMNNYSAKLIDEFSVEDCKTKEMTRKYEKYVNVGLASKYDVLKPRSYSDCVLEYLRKGRIDNDFIERELQKEEVLPWNVLRHYVTLENSEFNKNVNMTVGYLERGDFHSVDQMLSAGFVMLSVIHWGVCSKYSAKDVNGWCIKTMKEKFYGKCKDQKDLYEMWKRVADCIEDHTYFSKYVEFDDFMRDLNEVYYSFVGKLKNDLTVMLESLSDDNADKLSGVYDGFMPGVGFVKYSESSILASVDPKKFIEGFVRLKNESKYKVISIFFTHYEKAKDIKNVENMKRFYIDDLDKLKDIICLLKVEEENHSFVDNLNIRRLREHMESVVNNIDMAIK